MAMPLQSSVLSSDSESADDQGNPASAGLSSVVVRFDDQKTGRENSRGRLDGKMWFSWSI